VLKKRKILLGGMCYLPRCLLSSRRGLSLTISLRHSHRRPSLMFAPRHHQRPSLMFSLRNHRRPFLMFSLRNNHRPLLTWQGILRREERWLCIIIFDREYTETPIDPKSKPDMQKKNCGYLTSHLFILNGNHIL
jgi:hypothetical protein